MGLFLALIFPIVTLGRVLKLEQRIKQDVMTMYKSLVHLSLKYCVAFCAPHLKDTIGLEKVPIQAKLMIKGKMNNCLSYCLSSRFNVCALNAIEVY